MNFFVQDLDIERIVCLGRALDLLNATAQTYLFKAAFQMGVPKFLGDPKCRAFVALDVKGRISFCWGREFFDRISVHWASLGPVAFVLGHETLHITLNHLGRAGDRDSLIWNYAADITVNHICKYYGLTPLADCVVAENYAVYGVDPATQSTEEIYELLLPHKAYLPAFDPPNGSHESWEGLSEDQTTQLAATAEAIAEKASQEDIDSGNSSFGTVLPGTGALGELRSIDPVYQTAVPWERLLRNFVGSILCPATGDRWDYPHHRLTACWGQVMLPVERESAKPYKIHMVFGVDASGSIDEDTLAKFRGIAESLPPTYKVSYCSFDVDCYPLNSLDAIKGGGGTSLAKLDEWVEKLGDVDAVVVVTDGVFPKPVLKRPASWVFVLDGRVSKYIPHQSTIFRVG